MLTRFSGFGRAAALLVSFLGVLLAPPLAQPAIAPTQFNPIVAENRLPGSDEWRLNRPGFAVADDTVGQIKGYVAAPSVDQGGQLVLHVSVAAAQNYTVDIYRIGWYAGKGGRRVQHLGPFAGTRQAVCPNDGSTGLTACRWTPSLTLLVPRAWTVGVYVVLLTNSENYQNYVPFVVRDDQRTGDFIYKQPINTYQAYNNFPDDHRSGKSLYEHNSYGPRTVTDTPRAVKVSFDRPYAGNGAGQFFEWEYYLVRWLERSGYDISYMTDIDVHAHPASLTRAKGVISAGHDEYWSQPMYDAMTAARDTGVNLAFFGADVATWQVRYEGSFSGVANRVLVCYRAAAIDPVQDASLRTVLWSDPPLNRPPQMLVGVQYQFLLTANVEFRVTQSGNWVYANTGFKNGDVVAGIVGYEVDSSMPGLALPPAADGSYAILSASPVTSDLGRTGVSNSSIYRARSGAWVFATGTMAWSWALDPERNYDPRVEQASANVLYRFLAGIPQTPTPAAGAVNSRYAEVILAKHPLAYWPLSDGPGPDVGDISGERHTGLRLGNVTPGEIRHVDGSSTRTASSDGTGSVFLPSLSRVTDFTIEGWAFLTEPDWNSNVFYDNTLYGAADHVRLLVRPGAPAAINTHGYFGVWLNGTEYELQPMHQGIDNTHQWVHWVLTRRSATLTVFRNGEQVAQRNDLPPLATADISGALFTQNDSLHLKGALSNVAVYGATLSADDVRAHYALGRQVLTSGPVAIPAD